MQQSSSSSPIQPPKMHIRAMIGILVCVVILIIGVSWYLTTLPPVNPEEQTQSMTLFPFSKKTQRSESLATVVGGDITVLPPAIPQPILTGTLPEEQQFSAQSILVKDTKTGMLLYGKNPYSERPIASVTKLMSALVLLESTIDWSMQATVVSDDLVDNHMEAGDIYTMEELWQAALVASSNKAIFTLADHVGWPREAFVERMNQKAIELGMSQTHFVEPTGLDEQNTSSASDLALLLHEVMRIDKIRTTLLLPEATIIPSQTAKPYHMWNTNWLLLEWVPHSFAHILGGKTGFIPASGYNFVMQVEHKDGRILDVIVLGAAIHEARFTEARDVATAIFDAYTWQ